jgi:hypothetical protein
MWQECALLLEGVVLDQRTVQVRISMDIRLWTVRQSRTPTQRLSTRHQPLTR